LVLFKPSSSTLDAYRQISQYYDTKERIASTPTYSSSKETFVMPDSAERRALLAEKHVHLTPTECGYLVCVQLKPPQPEERPQKHRQ
jgi:hypothetical protein